jgi:uncharacterized membrane protein YvlD (DUF360 family)
VEGDAMRRHLAGTHGVPLHTNKYKEFHMLIFLIRMALLVLALLVVVPAFTGGAVAIRQGGFFRGLLALLVIGLLNSAFWFVFALLTAGGVIVANALTFGLVGILLNALAFAGAGKLMPNTLHVRDFGSAFWASIVMTLCSYVIHLIA